MELSRARYGSGSGEAFFQVLDFHFLIGYAAVGEVNGWYVG